MRDPLIDPLPGGSLRRVLLPVTFRRHHLTRSTGFTVISVEIWTTGLVVNIHLVSDASTDPSPPRIAVEDHWGTAYSLAGSTTVGTRNLQTFSPSLPSGTRSLTITSTDDADARLVVTLAVPPDFAPDVP
jgi:hypothetical protein